MAESSVTTDPVDYDPHIQVDRIVGYGGETYARVKYRTEGGEFYGMILNPASDYKDLLNDPVAVLSMMQAYEKRSHGLG